MIDQERQAGVDIMLATKLTNEKCARGCRVRGVKTESPLFARDKRARVSSKKGSIIKAANSAMQVNK